MNINALDKSQFCKLNDYQKDLYNKTHFDGKKIKRIKTYQPHQKKHSYPKICGVGKLLKYVATHKWDKMYMMC